MGFLSSLLGVLGFGVGICGGLLLGFFLFIYREPNKVQVQFYYIIVIYLFILCFLFSF